LAISVDWPTGVITVPQSDLTLISGSLYELDTGTFREALIALEDDEEGMPWPRTHVHNTEVTVAGVTFARTIEILSPYSITFEDTGSDYTVRLSGSNNNIFDAENGVLNSTPGVTVIGQNSAGLQTVVSGSGLSATQNDWLNDIFRMLIGNRLELDDGDTLNWVLYADDGTTPLYRWSVTDKDGDPIAQPAGGSANRSAAS